MNAKAMQEKLDSHPDFTNVPTPVEQFKKYKKRRLLKKV